MRSNRRQQAGFTLMELMVVIVIVAILAAVAVPLYINYVRDAQRTEAKGAIGAVITAEQVYYQKTGGANYTMDLEALDVDLSDIESKWLVQITDAGDKHFTIEATQLGAASDTLKVMYEYNRESGLSKWTP